MLTNQLPTSSIIIFELSLMFIITPGSIVKVARHL
jgi:hypothetical protein